MLIQPLKDLAKKKYADVVAYRWNSAEFVQSLKMMYEETVETDRPLKDVAVNVAAKHAKQLVDRGEFVELCKENGELAFDILKTSLELTEPQPAEPDMWGFGVPAVAKKRSR